MKRYIPQKALLLIFLYSFSYMVYSQECFDFEQPNSITNWQGGSILGIANLQVTTSVGSNSTNHLYFEDQGGVSLAVNNIDFDGNWLVKGKDGCLCFDYRVNWQSTNSSNRKGPNFWIYRINPGQNISQINNVADWSNTFVNGNYSGLLAIFTPNPSNPTIPKNQWLRYCLPLTDPNGQIPSNTYGTWTIRQSIPGSGSTPSSVNTLSGAAALSAWNSLITNVEGVILSADYHGNPNEEVSFDNFCWSCTDDPPPPDDPQPCCDIPGLEVSIRKPRLGSDQLNLVLGGITTPIQEIEVAVADYHYNYEDEACKPGNLGIFGTLSSNQNNLNGLILSGNGNQVISWAAGNPTIYNGQIPIKITKPNILKLDCCTGTFNICLKVKITDVNCKVCEKIICIELPLQEQKIISNDLPVELPGSGLNNGPVLNDNEVYNPTTQKIWLNKNLGATRVAQSKDDSSAFGDLYQWGRLSDGHEQRNSLTTTIRSTGPNPSHSNFIISTQNWTLYTGTLWDGLNGLNNPCPMGYRIPTVAEMNAEISTWQPQNADGAFASPLKWVVAGARKGDDGLLTEVGLRGYYWTDEATSNGGVLSLRIFPFGAGIYGGNNPIALRERTFGYSVRCIKN